MTYERGIPMQAFIDGDRRPAVPRAKSSLFRCPSTRHTADAEGRPQKLEDVATIVLHSFLKMLLSDGMIHGDLHPGNMLVSDSNNPQVIMLDVGLAAKMSRQDEKNFSDLLRAVLFKDGRKVAQLVLERSPGDRSQVREEEQFVSEVGKLVDRVTGQGMNLGAFGLGEVLGEMLNLAYQHHVKLETRFVTVVTSIIVIEGVARQLLPRIDFMEEARPHLMKAAAETAAKTLMSGVGAAHSPTR